ncbi:hypothetical protein D3C84_516130 [compost metagenome]
MAFTRQRHRARLTITGQQAADLGHHQVPIAQQVEAHHRNQHQVGQPTHQCQARRRGLAQHHSNNVGGLPHVFADGRLDLVELPEAVCQPHPGLHPWHRRVLQPVEHLRCQLIQTKQLFGQHGHQHQQQRHDDQGKQRKHGHHPPGSRQAVFFQAIDQGIEQVSQPQSDQKGGENRMQQVHKHAQQGDPSQPDPTPRIGHEQLHIASI